jgi:hypothetical protein
LRLPDSRTRFGVREYLLAAARDQRAAWTALAARAVASGNPALDYIGTGGPTPLRIPVTADR